MKPLPKESGFFVNITYTRVISFWMKSIIEQIVSKQIESIPIIGDYTCTLIKNYNDYKVHGTGVFVRISNLYLLISAAHVLDDFDELFIPLQEGKTLIKPGGEIIINNPKSLREHDDLDIGIVILDDVTVEDIKQNYNFVNENDLQINHKLSYLNSYIVFGYPSSWSKKSMSRNSFHSRPFISFTKSADVKEYSKLNRNEFLNIVVEYNRQETVNFKSKKMSYGPDLFGISGCGLWYSNPEDYKINASPKLVGIMTDWPISNKTKLIATRIDAVTEILRKKGYINFLESDMFSFK
ncbi:hypothetical protein [Chryseobacterium carnipullorum]|uniref:hypothetical protein n=1 Tax=Chryseobacterium carnipullorum TaxID=1124835 RepID=UPI000E8CFB99|nr:hypothetical protein [Chryseobacterium carnipullorum]HBV16711.1 hypothetical protein [Chryseobacterium carnipullorum]